MKSAPYISVIALALGTLGLTSCDKAPARLRKQIREKDYYGSEVLESVVTIFEFREKST